MLTLTETIQLFKDLSLNSVVDAKAKRFVNQSIKTILANSRIPLNFSKMNIATAIGISAYPLKANCSQVQTITFLNGGITFPLKIATTEAEFDIERITNTSSDIPTICYVKDNILTIYPTPVSTVTVLNVVFSKKQPDLKTDDLSTSGTVTNGSTNVTGLTGVTAKMANYSFKSDDGIWYDIDTVVGPTQITLVSPYLGISGTYPSTIGELIPLPDGYEMLPVFDALSLYFLGDEGKLATSDRYKNKFDIMFSAMLDTSGANSNKVTGTAFPNTPRPAFFVSN